MDPAPLPADPASAEPELGAVCAVLLCVPIAVGFFYFLAMNFLNDVPAWDQSVWGNGQWEVGCAPLPGQMEE